MLDRIALGGIDVLAAGELLERGVVVAFTGREGGVSTGACSSLNLSYDVGDAPGDVTANRLLVSRALGAPLERWVVGRQVHGARVSVAGPLEVGRGARDFLSGLPRTDALVTGQPDCALCVLTADCLPVVMVATGGACGRAVAVAHAGWRGALGGATAAALRALAGFAVCPPGEILVFMGPHIRSCCMEVGEDVGADFVRRFGDTVTRPDDDTGKTFLDMERACELQLLEAGVSAGNIFGSGTCTCCGEGHFSFRASGGTCGRQGGFAAVLGEDWG